MFVCRLFFIISSAGYQTSNWSLKGLYFLFIHSQDGQPTVLIESQKPSVTSSPSFNVSVIAETSQQSPSSAETGLLHRLLTGQVEEADIYRAAEEANALQASGTTAESPSVAVSDTEDRGARGIQTPSGSSARLLFDEFDISEGCDGLDPFICRQEVPQSVDDITVSNPYSMWTTSQLAEGRSPSEFDVIGCRQSVQGANLAI
jgi:hypothetical protein